MLAGWIDLFIKVEQVLYSKIQIVNMESHWIISACILYITSTNRIVQRNKEKKQQTEKTKKQNTQERQQNPTTMDNAKCMTTKKRRETTNKHTKKQQNMRKIISHNPNYCNYRKIKAP